MVALVYSRNFWCTATDGKIWHTLTGKGITCQEKSVHRVRKHYTTEEQLKTWAKIRGGLT